MDLGEHTYDEETLRALFATSPKGDASLQLAHQLIAAVLNRAAGGADLPVDEDGTPVSEIIAGAHGLIGENRLPADARGAAGAPWRVLAATLDDYNNGAFGTECADEEEEANRVLADIGVGADSHIGSEARFTPEDPAFVPAGGTREVWYHVRVTSHGPENATDATLTALLPDLTNDWVFFFGIGATWCTITENLLECAFEDLAPGEVRQIDLHTMITHAGDCPAAEAGLTATFEVATTATDIDLSNNVDAHTIHVACA